MTARIARTDATRVFSGAGRVARLARLASAVPLLAALDALALPAALRAQSGISPARALEAVRLPAGAAIRLDGRLDEPAWQAAPAATGFRQREPAEGEPATERTEVRVLYDDDHLYIGVHAYDSRPDRIIARQLARDASLGSSFFGPGGGDDAIQLILDTFRDRRNAYYFATNPRGVQVDGFITDESFFPDLNWDGVWDVRAQRTDDGWTAELAIPFRTVRFPSVEEPQAWGLNVQRVIARKNEASLWTAWSRDNEGLYRVSRAGDLTGLDLPARGTSVQVKPYALGQAGRDWVADPGGGSDLSADVGVDLKAALGSGLVLDLTVNTDFAQVEADDEQIDLTRFTLFFPEKREFFLENAGIFEFGAPSFGGPPQLLLFFSRRIGLVRTGFAEAQPVPLPGGVRLTGRAGRQTVGVLSVVTGAEKDLGQPVTNFAVARVKRDVGGRSYAGAIATHRMEEGGFENLAAGGDLNLWLTPQLVFQTFYARTSQSGAGGEDDAWRLWLDYTGDWIGWTAEHLEVGGDFVPGSGFVLRDDMARTFFHLRLTPRPPVPGLRYVHVVNQVEYVQGVESRSIQDRTWRLQVNPQANSGDDLSLILERRFQRLEGSFELTPGVFVPPGDYPEWAFTAQVNTSRSRAVSAGAGVAVQDFWGGERRGWTGAAAFSSPHAGLELGYEHHDVDVPAGAFDLDLVRLRLNLAASTRLFGNALVQYNSQTGLFSLNLRANFIHRPGSDLFVVFNDRRDVVDGRWSPRSRAFVVKLTYLRWL